MNGKKQHFKRGMIILWSGAVADIPNGFALCDGSGGTPDLRGNFVIGAGGTFNVDATGGEHLHSHTGNATHTHTLDSGKDVASGDGWRSQTVEPGLPGVTGVTDTYPPYYALAYIMKV